jgi:hypothetical protein
MINDNLLKPIPKMAEGQAKLILKSAGLALLKPKLFSIDQRKASKEAETYERIDLIGYDKKGGMFGLPIWDTVTLISPNYTDNKGNNVPSQSLTLDIALIEVNNDRNIVRTAVAGRNGTVKEYMSDGDYEVNIKGMLVSEFSNLPPAELLKAWRFITTCPEAVSIESNFLDYMEIFTIVINRPNIKQIEGARNAVSFELECYSDTPFEIDTNA